MMYYAVCVVVGYILAGLLTAILAREADLGDEGDATLAITAGLWPIYLVCVLIAGIPGRLWSVRKAVRGWWTR